MKIKTLGELQDTLDSEMGWRIKEIADLKTNVKTGKGLARSTLIRAGTALLYAHWEGFIKASSSLYVSFLNGQRFRYSELNGPFVVMGMKGHLDALRESGNYRGNLSALDFIRNNMDRRFKVDFSGVINTEANLSSKVFSNIAFSLCIPTANYEARYNLIDERLLRRRNMIAHGEYVDIEADEWRSLADEVLFLLRSYKTDIENAATNMTCKRRDLS
jgi:hypothetical protein